MTTMVLNRPEEKSAVDLRLEADEIALMNSAPMVNFMPADSDWLEAPEN